MVLARWRGILAQSYFLRLKYVELERITNVDLCCPFALKTTCLPSKGEHGMGRSVPSAFLLLTTIELYIVRGIFVKLLYFHWIQMNCLNLIIRDFKQILDKTNKKPNSS